jgi:hypothetical protein
MQLQLVLELQELLQIRELMEQTHNSKAKHLYWEAAAELIMTLLLELEQLVDQVEVVETIAKVQELQDRGMLVVLDIQLETMAQAEAAEVRVV